ncbi:MAG: putative Ig domain-containing protein [Nitrospiraceae bacterium]|nr:putative Ig domain-containing protein [Nitrospiraceae bacterium]
MSRKSYEVNRFASSLIVIGMLSFIFVLSISSPVRGSTDCTEGITDYWRFDESSGTTFADSVGTDNASCAAPSCPGFVVGRINNGLQFDGIDNGIDAPPAALFDWGSTDSFSIEFWMKTDSASTCSGGQVITGRVDSATKLQWWVGCWDGGAPAFVLIDKNGNAATLTGSTDLTDGLWHHIVAVRDASMNEMRLYVDKVKEASAEQSFTGGFDSATAALNIGWLNLDAGYHFAGTIDEVALYNRVLPEQIITQHYYDGSVGLRLGYCGCSSAVRIMPLGDSITLGRNDPALETNGAYEPPSNYITGYRKPLYWALHNAGYFFDFVGGRKSGSLATLFFDVDHQGELSASGYTAQDMASDVYNFLTANPADVVLLHIGTNNVDSPPYDTSTDTLNTILNEIYRYNSNITVVLALIINTKTAGTDAHNAVTQYNQNVKTLALNRIAAGDKIIIVDQENALVYPDDLYDEWHPTSSGYNKMAKVWLNALTSFLPVCIQVAPTITTTPVTSVIAGKPYQYDVDATGNPAPGYDLLLGYPAGMTIDRTTGLIQWAPSSSDVGSVSVTVEANNGIDPLANQSFTINVAEPPPCPEGMIHYWTLDEAGGPPYKDLYGINDATCVDCPTATTGIIGGAQQFTATNQVNAADDNTFDWGAADSFSIEFWMKTDSASTCSGGQVIAGRVDSATKLQWWVGCWDGGAPAFVLIDKDGTSAILDGSTPLTDGLWHYIVAVRDAGTNEVRLYVDKVKEASKVQSYTSGFDSASAALSIGWLNLDAGYHFVGTIDDMALYSKPLSDTEILQHYTYGVGGTGYCELIAPTIVSSAITTGITGALYTYDVNAMGNPAPTYSFTTFPEGMTINETTGLIQWTPLAVGDVSVTVRASNGVGTPADQGFTIHVDASIAPTITTTPATAVYAGKPYQYDVDATGNPVPTYSLITYPPGMTINSATGLIQWTPESAGDFNVTVRATNVAGYVDQPFKISVAAVPPLPAAMIHYWTLDEAGGPPYKDLYGINDATCADCPTATTGIIGGAQQFTATNQVNAANDNTFDWGAADSFSIEFWMKTDAGSTCSGNQVVMGRNDSATKLHWWVGCRGTTGAAAFVLIDKDGNSDMLTGSTVTDGGWHHIVAVRDAGTNEVRLYVDTVKASIGKTYPGGFDSATAALNIGWLNLDEGYHFVGTADEMALYNRALSDTEILRHYTNGQSGEGYSYGLAVKRIGAATEYYSVIQDAYDAASDGDIIQSEALPFNEGLLFDRDIQVTLEGGFDSNFSSPPTGYTTVVTAAEPLTISKGTVVVNRLVLK